MKDSIVLIYAVNDFEDATLFSLWAYKKRKPGIIIHPDYNHEY